MRSMLDLGFVQEPLDKHWQESQGSRCQVHGNAGNYLWAIMTYGLQAFLNDFSNGDN